MSAVADMHDHVTDADLAEVLDGTGPLCPGCVRVLVEHLWTERAELASLADSLTAERDRLAEQVKRARTWHPQQCSGACNLDYGCECEDRDLMCGECNERWPCGTIRALDGTEAGS